MKTNAHYRKISTIHFADENEAARVRVNEGSAPDFAQALAGHRAEKEAARRASLSKFQAAEELIAQGKATALDEALDLVADERGEPRSNSVARVVADAGPISAEALREMQIAQDALAAATKKWVQSRQAPISLINTRQALANAVDRAKAALVVIAGKRATIERRRNKAFDTLQRKLRAGDALVGFELLADSGVFVAGMDIALRELESIWKAEADLCRKAEVEKLEFENANSAAFQEVERRAAPASSSAKAAAKA